MKRLTDRLPDGTAYVVSETGSESVGHFTTQRRLPELIAKIAAYEDTGLEPEEIEMAIQNSYTADQIEAIQGEAYDLGADSVLRNHFGIPWDDAAYIRKNIIHLRELAKAEQEGRLKIIKKAPEGARCGNCADFIRNAGTAGGRCRTQHRRWGGSKSELRMVAQSTKACAAFTPCEEAKEATP